jgi:hypothetical protein
MGVLKFRLHPPELANQFPELRKAYFTGMDRTPGWLSVELRPGLLLCHRETPESGRLFVPWPVEGFGTPIIGTATLAERPEPYDLAVELARGKLNDVRNQTADWLQLGLRAPAELEAKLHEAQRAFARAVTAQAEPERAAAFARASLKATFEAGQILVAAYTTQVLQNRLAYTPRLPTWLACGLEGVPKAAPWSGTLVEAINAAQIRCAWARIAPGEGHYRWDEVDAQLSWCRKRRLTPMAGPLLEFHPNALPDWLWLYEDDLEGITDMIIDLVRQAVSRYRGKVPVWHIVHRAGSSEILGLSEEDQFRLTAKLLQVARQADPSAQLVLDLDRPWAEWMGSTPFQLGPLHMADELARAELGLTGLGLEIAPGFSAPGSHIRDLFDFSKLLDLYSLLNLPLYITLALPSSAEPDPQAATAVRVETEQWPAPPDEQLQRAWVQDWVSLAIAKPFVRAVTWLQPSDAAPHLYPAAGLFRADQTPKPAFDWLRSIRQAYLE